MRKSRKYNGTEIAVIGMACKFPGANDYRKFWDNIVRKEESISFTDIKELKESGISEDIINDPNFINCKGGIIEDKDCFDSAFFKYTPLEAELMDPQVRLFHEYAWKALEDSGYITERSKINIGVYAGSSSNFYWQGGSHLSGATKRYGVFSADTLIDNQILCTRLSYKLGLNGPSVYLNSTCSTSGLAIHSATRGLLTGDCQMALTGGVSIRTEDQKGYYYQEGMVLSKDGHCCVFDANSSGIIPGEGVGVVVLKLLTKAIEDGDHIYAVIRGSASGNDGNRKMTFTSPSVKGQAFVIKKAQRLAKVTSEQVTFIESHGTGTNLGDPIEIESLNTAFNTSKHQYCAISSVKPNIGHLDAASGVASLIKTSLALKNKTIPPTINHTIANPKIDFKNSPFFVSTEAQPWESNGELRIAGVNNFGIGGTNIHLVLEEAPEKPGTTVPANHYILKFSAESEQSLIDILQETSTFLKEHTNELNLADIAFTLQTKRCDFKYRYYTVVETINDAIVDFDRSVEQMSASISKVKKTNDMVFVFPGYGSQFRNMTRNLYEKNGLYKKYLDQCFGLLQEFSGANFHDICFSDDPDSGEDILNHPKYAQALTFSIDYALAQVLMVYGIVPKAMIGHSLGEFVAATIAGVFQLEDILKILIKRGELSQKLAPGKMLAVIYPLDKVEAIVPGHIDVALVNTTDNFVVSGASDAIEHFQEQLLELGITSKMIPGSLAYHSSLVETVENEFEREVVKYSLKAPAIPFISNVTGDWISDEDARSASYWKRHFRETVQFEKGISRLLKEYDTFIEVGSGNTLSKFIRLHEDTTTQVNVLNLSRHRNEEADDYQYLLRRMGEIWCMGYPIDWTKFHEGRKAKNVSLPTYCFEKKRYWNTFDLDAGIKKYTSDKLSVKNPDPNQWLYRPVWEKSIQPTISKQVSENHYYLYFKEGNKESDKNNLIPLTGNVVTVLKGEAYGKISDSTYEINPEKADDYNKLLNELEDSGFYFDRLLYCWSIHSDQSKVSSTSFHASQKAGFYSLINIVNAVNRIDAISRTMNIIAITNNSQEVIGNDLLHPENATLYSFCLVASQENSNIDCRCIDIDLKPDKEILDSEIYEKILHEFECRSAEPVAYRNHARWVKTYKKINLKNISDSQFTIEKRGTYLMIGGFGDVGLSIGKHLAKESQGTLIYTSRKTFPKRENWEALIQDGSIDPSIRTHIKELLFIESLGANCEVYTADATQNNEMESLLQLLEDKYTRINGIVYCAGASNLEDTFVSLNNITVSQCERQFKPKVDGLLVLDQVLNKREYDFCLLTSSIASLLGGIGYSAYSAANAFMDTYCSYRNSSNKVKWLSVNWDAWRGSNDDNIQTTMSPVEGGITFNNALRFIQNGQIVTSILDLDHRINQWVNETYKSKSIANNSDDDHQEQVFKEVKTLTLNQRSLRIYNSIFGRNDICEEDNYYDLGGDSLLALTLASAILQEFNVKIPVQYILTNPGIKDIIGFVSANEAVKKFPVVDAGGIKESKPSYGKGQYGLIPSDIDILSEKYDVKKVYPLSPMQEGMYFNYLQNMHSRDYLIQNTYTLEGDIDVQLVGEALQVLTQRHEIFQSVFVHNHLVRPVQVVQNNASSVFYTHDIRDKNATEQQEYIHDLKANESRQAFDLNKDALMRIQLVQLADNAYKLIWTLHHILLDGWCVSIVIAEFLHIFNNLSAGTSVSLPDSVPYQNYIDWIEKKDKRKAQDYWRSYLEGYEKEAVLPKRKDNKLMGLQYDAREVVFNLSEELSNKLVNTSKRNNITPYGLLQTCWGILLSKYNNCRDVVFGSVVSGRPSEIDGVENIVGPFINTIPLRIAYTDSDTVDSIIKKITNSPLYDHGLHFLPLAEIQSSSALKKNLINHVLISGDFEPIHNAITENYNAKLSFNITDIESEEQTNYDFNLGLAYIGDKQYFRFIYNQHVYKEESMEKLARHFTYLIEQILENPSQRIDEISYCMPIEELENTWNAISERVVLKQPNQAGRKYVLTESEVELSKRDTLNKDDLQTVLLLVFSQLYENQVCGEYVHLNGGKYLVPTGFPHGETSEVSSLTEYLRDEKDKQLKAASTQPVEVYSERLTNAIACIDLAVEMVNEHDFKQADEAFFSNRHAQNCNLANTLVVCSDSGFVRMKYYSGSDTKGFLDAVTVCLLNENVQNKLVKSNLQFNDIIQAMPSNNLEDMLDDYLKAL